jgi:hypothetical protein
MWTTTSWATARDIGRAWLEAEERQVEGALNDGLIQEVEYDDEAEN